MRLKYIVFYTITISLLLFVIFFSDNIVSTILKLKSKKFGYDIIWFNSYLKYNNLNGRALLASCNRNINGFCDKFGWVDVKYDNKHSDIYKGMGLFEKWEKIDNSQDLYMILLNPQDDTNFKIRITNDISLYNSSVNSIKLDGVNRTSLFIESLKYGPNNNIEIAKRIGYFYELNQNIINKYINKGDVVTVYTIKKNQQNIQDMNVIRRDDNNIPIALNLVIRRFSII